MTEKHSALPTLREIWAAHSWKKDYERYLPISRFVFRPVGFLLTWLAIRAELTSEAVSWMSGAVGLTGCICLMSSSTAMVALGLGLLLFFNLLDCVDGSIARSMKTENPYGRFLDSVCGGFIDMAFWGVIGVTVFRHPDLLGWPTAFGHRPFLWLALGFATCYLSIFVGFLEGNFDDLLRNQWDRLRHEREGKKRTEGSRKQDEKKCGSPIESRTRKTLRIINTNLRVRETHYAFLILVFFYRAIDFLLLAYFWYYLLQSILLLMVYSTRGELIRKSR